MMLRVMTAHNSLLVELDPETAEAANPAKAWLTSRALFHVPGGAAFIAIPGTDARAPRVVAVEAIQSIEVVR